MEIEGEIKKTAVRIKMSRVRSESSCGSGRQRCSAVGPSRVVATGRLGKTPSVQREAAAASAGTKLTEQLRRGARGDTVEGHARATVKNDKAE